MPVNTGGSNGGATAVSSDGTHSVVTIHYPGPPAKDETYDPAPDWLVKRCDAAVPPRDKIDVACDGAGNPTSASNHT